MHKKKKQRKRKTLSFSSRSAAENNFLGMVTSYNALAGSSFRFGNERRVAVHSQTHFRRDRKSTRLNSSHQR